MSPIASGKSGEYLDEQVNGLVIEGVDEEDDEDYNGYYDGENGQNYDPVLGKILNHIGTVARLTFDCPSTTTTTINHSTSLSILYTTPSTLRHHLQRTPDTPSVCPTSWARGLGSADRTVGVDNVFPNATPMPLHSATNLTQLLLPQS